MTINLQEMFLTGNIPKAKLPKETPATQLSNLPPIQSMFLGKEPIQTDFPRVKSAMQPSPYGDFQTVPEYTPQEMWKSIISLPKNTIKDAFSFIPNILKLITNIPALWTQVLDPDYYTRLQEIGGEQIDIMEIGQNFLHSLPQAGKSLFTKMIFPSLRRTFETAWAGTIGIGGKIPDPISLLVEAWDNKGEIETLGYAKWFDKTYEETMAKGGAGGFWRTFKRYTDNPLYSMFEDVSNIAMVVGTIGKAIELPLRLSGTIPMAIKKGVPVQYMDDLAGGTIRAFDTIPLEYMDDFSNLGVRVLPEAMTAYKLAAFKRTMLGLPKNTVKTIWNEMSSDPIVDSLLKRVHLDKTAKKLNSYLFGIKEKEDIAGMEIGDLVRDMQKSSKKMSPKEIIITSTLAQVDGGGISLNGLKNYLKTYPNKAVSKISNMVKYINSKLPEESWVTPTDIEKYFDYIPPDAHKFIQQVGRISKYTDQDYVKVFANYTDDGISKTTDLIKPANIKNAMSSQEGMLLESNNLAKGTIPEFFNRLSHAPSETSDFKGVIRDVAKESGYQIGIAPPKAYPKSYQFLDDAEKVRYFSTQKAWNKTWKQLPEDIRNYNGMPIDRMAERLGSVAGEFGISKPADILKYFKKVKGGITESKLQTSTLYLETAKRAMEEKLLQVQRPIQEIGAKLVEGKWQPIGGYVKDRVKGLYDYVLPKIKAHWNTVDQQKFNQLAASLGDETSGAGYRYFIKELYGDIPSTLYKAEGMLIKKFDYDLIRKLSNIKIKQFAAGVADDLVFGEAELITGIAKNHLKNFGFKPAYVPHRTADMMRQHSWAWRPKLKEPIYSFLFKREGKAYEIARTPEAILQSLQERSWYSLDRDFQGLLEKEFGQIKAFAGAVKEMPTKFKGVLQKIDDVPEGFKVASWNKKVVIPKAISDSLSWMTAQNQPKWLKTLFNATALPRRLWMKSVLGMPRLAFNNTIGNAVLYALSGGDPRNIFKAMRMFNECRKEAFAMGDGSIKNTMDIVFNKYGKTLVSGFSERVRAGMQDDIGMTTSLLSKLDETHPNIAKLGVEANKKLKWVESVGLDWMFNKTMDMSGASEAVFRITTALDKVPFGTSLENLQRINPTLYSDVVAHVDKFLFNYRKLTPVESVVFRRIIPFYAWNKNIARLAVTLPFENPLKFHIIRYLGATMEDAYWSSMAEEKGWDLTGEEAKNLIPKYMQERYRLPKGLVTFAKKLGFTDTDNDLWISIMGFNPFADVPTDLSGLTRLIDPMIASGVEALTGVSLWKQKPYFLPYEEVEFGVEKKKPSYLQVYATKFPQYQLARNLIKGASTDIHGNVYTNKYGKPIYKKNRWAELLKMTGVNIAQMDLNQIWSDEMKRQKKARTIMEKWEKEQDLYKKKYGFTASIKTKIQNLVKGSSIDTADMGIEDIQKLFLYGDEGRK